MRHGARALLAAGESLFRFSNLCPLPVAHADSHLFDGRPQKSQCDQDLGVSVSRDHLASHCLRRIPSSARAWASTLGETLV